MRFIFSKQTEGKKKAAGAETYGHICNRWGGWRWRSAWGWSWPRRAWRRRSARCSTAWRRTGTWGSARCCAPARSSWAAPRRAVLRGRRARRQLKRTRPHSPAPRTVSTPAATTTATTRRNHTHLTLLSIPCPPLSFSSSSSRRRLQLWAVLRSMILQASHGASIYAARRSTERGSKPSLGGRLRIPAGRTVWKPRKWRSHWRALSVARTELCSVQFGSVTYCTPLCWGACLASIKFSPKSLKICHVNGPWRKDFARRSVHNHHRCVGGLLLDQWHGRSSWKREKESTLPFPDRHRPLQYKAAVRTCSRKICWCQSARGKNRSELSSSEFIGLIPLMHYTDSGTLINRVIMILYTCYTWSRANRSTHHTA